jgi:E3 ubiquitin-protein ligase EDD1
LSTTSSPSSEDKRPRLDNLAADYEESWQLSDVIFVEDSKSSNFLGKVVKIDADFVLVKMHSQSSSSTMRHSTNTTTTASSECDAEVQAMNFLDNLRIFQKNQLQLVKSSSSSSSSSSSFYKIPDFMQKVPKKLSDFGNVLCLAVQQNGIHAIIYKENAIFHVIYDLLSNKIVKEKRFPSSLSFLPHLSSSNNNNKNIRMFLLDNPSFNITTLLDSNSTFYPVNDLPGTHLLKEPQWKNLFPIKFFSQCLLTPSKLNETHKTNTNSTSTKLNYVTLFSMRIERLIASILRCDLNSVNSILAQIEKDVGGVANLNSIKLNQILNERIDGNRNIIHAAVYACAPTSNSLSSFSAYTSASSSINLNKFSSDSGLSSDIYATYGSNSSTSKKK